MKTSSFRAFKTHKYKWTDYQKIATRSRHYNTPSQEKEAKKINKKMANPSNLLLDTSPQGRNNAQQRQSVQKRTGILQTPKSGPIPDCWKYGYNFIPGHLSNCPAKNEVCRKCKKIGYYAKMLKAEMPPRTRQRPQIRINTQSRSTTTSNQINNY